MGQLQGSGGEVLKTGQPEGKETDSLIPARPYPRRQRSHGTGQGLRPLARPEKNGPVADRPPEIADSPGVQRKEKGA